VDIDGRADIYGLGATFYHMVTGRVPFMADDPTVVMRKHLRDELIPPDHINTSLSAGASEVIEVMMKKRKEDRYNNMEELLDDLEAVRRGEAPGRAHQRFDVSALEQLEDGNAVVQEEEEESSENKIANYKIAIVILGAATAISILAIVLILMFHGR
jgi:eukaryotic-like serine/threonine-protein kinase